MALLLLVDQPPKSARLGRSLLRTPAAFVGLVPKKKREVVRTRTVREDSSDRHTGGADPACDPLLEPVLTHTRVKCEYRGMSDGVSGEVTCAVREVTAKAR